MNRCVNFGTEVFDFIDRRYITRRIMSMGTFAMVLYALFWCFDFAQSSQRTGVDVAAIIAAVTAPLNLLMGYMFGQYVQATPTIPPPLPPPPAPGSTQVNINTTPAATQVEPSVGPTGKTDF